MSCTIDSGYTIGCLNGIGGIKAIYVNSVDAIDVPNDGTFTVAADLVTTIAAMTVYKFELKRELSSMEVTTTRDGNNGTSFDEQQVTAVFLNLTAVQYANLTALADRRNNVFVEDNDGVVYLLGATQGMDVQSGVLNTGTSYGDQKGYTLTLSAREPATYYCNAIASITGLTVAP